jgi:hypothetical protein
MSAQRAGEEKPMKYIQVGFLIGAVVTVAAWAESPDLLIKGTLQVQSSANPDDKSTNRGVSLVLRLYDQKVGGTLLFQERQTVQVDDAGIFVASVGDGTRGGVPASITDRHGTVWGEYVLASTAFINTVNSRQQITHRKEDIGTNVLVNVPTSTVLCFTCGGAWPIRVGDWNVVNAPNNVRERGGSCALPFILRQDTRPFLCARD